MPTLKRACVVVLAVTLASSCSGSSTTPTPTPAPPPTPPVNVTGTWILQTGLLDQTTTWTLTQSGSDVTGTATRVAAFVVSDKGTITGSVSDSTFTFGWDNITEYAVQPPTLRVQPVL